MPRKRYPIFQKLSNLLKTSFFIAKLRKPIIPKLFLLKKLKNRKDLRHLKYYNYGFSIDYQFSPSSTPLIHGKRFKNRSCGDLNSLLFLFGCLGNLKSEGNGVVGQYNLNLEALPVAVVEDDDFEEDLCEPIDWGDENDESVDQRAERFIARFYQEMRMQRTQSL